MSPSIARNPTQFFAVVGAAYIPERHLDSRCRYLMPDQDRGLLGRALDLLHQFWNAGDHQRSPSFH